MALDATAKAHLEAIFRSETDDHCKELNRVFLALEKQPDAAEKERLLGEAFRAAHNFKGAAGAVGLESAAALAHALENILEGARQFGLPFSAPLFDLLYRVVDTLGLAGNGGRADEPDSNVAELLAELKALSATPSAPSISDAPLLGRSDSPAAPPPGLSPMPKVTPRSSETVRLPATRLDNMLELLGELVLPRIETEEGLKDMAALQADIEAWQRDWRKLRPQLRQIQREELRSAPLLRFLEGTESRLASLGPALKALHTRLSGATGHLASLTDTLQLDVKQFRMLPFGRLEDGFQRQVRDLARSLGKQARLTVMGADTELDRRVLEEMKDPLTHLLRNALDHGLEAPEMRERLGKPVVGTIRMEACQRGATIVIEVEDDGAGLDASAIRSTAADHHLVADDDLKAMTERDVLRLVFLPGLSTSTDITSVSGRGVGLDVVARNVERLSGRIDLDSLPGRGTRFILTLPLTMTTQRAVVVEAGGALYALPTAALERVLKRSLLGVVGGRTVLEYEGGAIPVAILTELFGILDQGTRAVGPLSTVLMLVRAGAERVALAVDRLVGEQEVVVKSLGFPLVNVAGVAGATILASGQVVPILNIGDLVRMAAKSQGSPPSGRERAEPEPRRQRVLVVDDSLTTRTMERYILEAAGFEVGLAGDGAEAFNLLLEQGCDLLVSDVTMPQLDGISLTEKVRQEPKFRDLPIILVTAMESTEDRERGLQAGADAYIVKSTFDQDRLLRTIRELV